MKWVDIEKELQQVLQEIKRLKKEVEPGVLNVDPRLKALMKKVERIADVFDAICLTLELLCTHPELKEDAKRITKKLEREFLLLGEIRNELKDLYYGEI